MWRNYISASNRQNRLNELLEIFGIQGGPLPQWPTYIRRMLFTKGKLDHGKRIILTTFFWINGIDWRLMIERVNLMELCADNADYREVETLLAAYRENRYPRGSYGYHVGYQQWLWCDWSPKFPYRI